MNQKDHKLWLRHLSRVLGFVDNSAFLILAIEFTKYVNVMNRGNFMILFYGEYSKFQGTQTSKQFQIRIHGVSYDIHT